MVDALFLEVVGGVFLLLYGVRITGQGFELAFSGPLRQLRAVPDDGRVRPFLVGILGTGLLQSSGAVVTLLISFSEFATIPLAQSLSVVLGADIGSTLVVQLLAFRLYRFAFPVVAVGVVLFLWGRSPRHRGAGQGVLGFGFILLALRFLSEAAGGAARIESFGVFLGDLGDAPFLLFALGILFSALFQSGTAVLLVLMAFAQDGLLPATAVLPLVLGANVGGTSVAFVATSGLAAPGRRIAVGHALMKIVGTLAFFLLIPLVKGVLPAISGNASRYVANAHTLLNLFLALLFLPFVPRIASFLEWLVREPSGTAAGGAPAYLDRQHLPVAGAALGQVAREILRMADKIQGMHDAGLEALRGGGRGFADRIAREDDVVDRLTREIKEFLSALGEGALDPEQTQRAVAYIAVVTDLENIADFIDKTLGEHLRRLDDEGRRFSDEGVGELAAFMRDVGEMYREAVSSFVTGDAKAAQIVIRKKEEIGRRERELRLAHIARLRRGTPEALESSAAHLDILASWKVIASHCASIAYSVLAIDSSARSR